MEKIGIKVCPNSREHWDSYLVEVTTTKGTKIRYIAKIDDKVPPARRNVEIVVALCTLKPDIHLGSISVYRVETEVISHYDVVFAEVLESRIL